MEGLITETEQEKPPLLPLLHGTRTPSQDLGSEYTSDGSVDINKRPALKRNTGNWRACFMILGVEFCECVSYFAISNNLVTYLTTALHESKVTASRNVSAWIGTYFLTPLIGAFLADTYWGRYWTVVASAPIQITGMLILTFSTSISTSNFRGDVHRNVVYLGLYLVALGSGGIKPCTSTFGAHQFDSADSMELVKKGSYFNWYYFLISTSSLLSGTVLVWLQDNVGWGVSFAIPMVLMVSGLATFTAGSRMYRYRKVSASPFTSLCQVVVAATRKWHLRLPDDSSLLYELMTSPLAAEASHKIQHTDRFRFLDKAAIVPPTHETCAASKCSWRLCTVTQVEELKMLVWMSPIWASFVIFYAVSGQLSSTFVEQGMFMDNHVGPFAIPPASLSIFGVLSVLLLVPIYETMLVPLARSFTGKDKGFSQMQRLGIGLALSMLSMIYSASVEARRLAMARANGLTEQNVAVPMSILWQVPAYFLHGASEVFASIGVTELFYDEAPDSMKSLCAALGQLAITTGAYFNVFVFGVVAVVTTRGGAPGWIPDNLNQGHLDYFFWLMAALSSLNLAQFVCYSMRFRGKKTC